MFSTETEAMVKEDILLMSLGEQMYSMIGELYPLCRSITGKGTLQTLKMIRNHVPLTISKIPTGTKVFDWEIPKEWNINKAYIRNSKGDTIVDFHNSNLHVVNYSAPVHKHVSLAELKEHLFTLPDHPDWIPYRTSYYHEDWGFCISYNQMKMLKDDVYEVYIDSSLDQGHLAYGEFVVHGESNEEVLISTHICHPSLCNDNLSGIVVAVFLAKHLMKKRPRYTYRFLFIPGTIGAITWLSINELRVRRIKHGLVTTLLGDSSPFTYKRSRRGNAAIDRVVEYVLSAKKRLHAVRDFSPYGYDERQFCSPGFDLPVGCLTRTPYGEFPEYHTSADNMDFVSAQSLEESLDLFKDIVEVLEADQYYLNRYPKGEPQLGKRGLYNTTGGSNGHETLHLAYLWILNLSDGQHSLLDIAKRSGVSVSTLKDAAANLKNADLIMEGSIDQSS